MPPAGLDSAWDRPATSLAKACNRRPCLARFRLPPGAPDCCTCLQVRALKGYALHRSGKAEEALQVGSCNCAGCVRLSWGVLLRWEPGCRGGRLLSNSCGGGL